MAEENKTVKSSVRISATANEAGNATAKNGRVAKPILRSEQSQATSYSQKIQANNAAKEALGVDTFKKAASVAGISLTQVNDIQAIEAFQKKYGLPVTGMIDGNTENQIKSVARSRGARHSYVRPCSSGELFLTKKRMSVNDKSEDVKILQMNLAFLGYNIDKNEYAEGRFGKTTVAAIIKYQKEKNLPATGKYDLPTMQSIIKDITAHNPRVKEKKIELYTIKGSVHNYYWQPMDVIVVVADSNGVVLAERRTQKTGFYNLQFGVPSSAIKNKRSGYMPFKVKLILTTTDRIRKVIFEREITCRSRTTWSNFNEQVLADKTINYDGKYLGPSEYEKIDSRIGGTIGESMLYRLMSGDTSGLNGILLDRSYTFTEEQLHAYIMANLIDQQIPQYCSNYTQLIIGPDVIYAFIRKGLLDQKYINEFFSLRAKVFRRPAKVVETEPPVSSWLESIFLKPTKDLSEALRTASRDNIITRAHQIEHRSVWLSVDATRSVAAICAKLLEDNASLEGLLSCTNCSKDLYVPIGKIFAEFKALTPPFFARLEASNLLGKTILTHLSRVIEIGKVLFNNPDFIIPADSMISDSHVGVMAKWSANQWSSIGAFNLITEIRSRLLELYPDELFIADLQKLLPDDPVIRLLYDGIMFKNESERLVLSDFDCIQNYQFSVAEISNMDTRRLVSGLRRIYLITPDVSLAKALWEDKLTSAVAVRHTYTRSQFITYARAKGISTAIASKAYSNVEIQYMRVVSFYNQYVEAAANSKPDVVKQANLKNLFGSQDAYSYDKSMSLLGQSAYYVDLLRFLKKMPSEKSGKSAYDILIGKRPDLPKINLETRNSETLLPYIDLVCEILERELLKWKGTAIDYDKYNTLASSEALFARPSNVENSIYEQIYNAGYPATSSHFSLPQEEVRAYLNALGIPRYKLMQKFGKDEVAVAGEYFGFSNLEMSELKDKSSIKNAEMLSRWGLPKDGNILVRDFMRKTGLSYDETVTICGLFGFKLFGADLTNKGYPNIDTQAILIDEGDGLLLIQRFIRIWRHVNMEMASLYEFIKSIGNNNLDENTVVSLYRRLNPKTTCQIKNEIGEILSGLMIQEGLDPNQYKDDSYSETTKAIDPLDENECGISNDIQLRWAHIGSYSEEKRLAEEILPYVRNKFGNKWEEEVQKLYDPIRQSKRDALVDFMIDTCQRKVYSACPDWKSVADIHNDLLVDPMMNAPMQTTRIKQATGAIQLFVQRCLLNIEPDIHINAAELNDTTSEDTWAQWSWMKNYRVWEANRKLFFFPENWIEPELRDNMTPFFKEFLDNVDQVDATNENLEDALLEYLGKLDEVSHLEVCTLYREIIKESNTDILHIVARTKSNPTVHYYRNCNLNTRIWSAWEKIDLDVCGDQMTLSMYRGKLHLFWLTFVEKVLKPSRLPDSGDTASSVREPVKYYEIQLNWSCRKNGIWTSKSTSKKKLIHPWTRPQYSYDLRPFLDQSGKLHLDVYLTTSPEFNNANVFGNSTNPEFMCQFSNTPFNERFQPWHSSTFLFEGYVTDVFMKNMGYEGVNSVDFINKYFGEEGRSIKRLGQAYTGPSLYLPEGMHVKFNRLVCDSNLHSPSLNVGEDTNPAYNTRTLLSKAPDYFELLVTQQTVQMDALQKGAMMFFQDSNRAFSFKTVGSYQYKFDNFYHPFTQQYVRTINQKGVSGLMTRGMQTLTGGLSFKETYKPTDSVSTGYPVENVDFSIEGAYSIYNWELFFHIPLTIACRLSQNMQYEDAMNWFHYIFNPVEYTKDKTPQCYWVTKPFYDNCKIGENGTTSGRIETILKNISANASQLTAWKNNPFKPHIIAQYRTETYQKTVVMKYISNLINWADDLFRQDTWESINEAIMLYMMAAEILGDRPEKVLNDIASEREITDFNGLIDNLDEFGNNTKKVNVMLDAMLSLENSADINGFRGGENDSSPSSVEIPTLDMFYFTVPSNDDLVNYWDTVEDRLFKIRNSMNIDGVVRTLNLNAPEIDPAAMVKAVASGLDVAAAAQAANAARPEYRFKVVLAKSLELCAEAKAMGDKLLGAIEKEDAAQLTLLRSQQGISILKSGTILKKKEIESIEEGIRNLEISRARTEIVLDYYKNIEPISNKEAKVLQIASSSLETFAAIKALQASAAVSTLIPSIVAGIHGLMSSPVADSKLFSGEALASSMNLGAMILSASNELASQKSGILSTKASYERRASDWALQAKTAEKDIESLDSQISLQKTRLFMAEQELSNHEVQIENAEAEYNLIKSQFSGEQLYLWLKKESYAIYKKIYDMAFSYAKMAEICYDYELGANKPSSVPSITNKWNATYKGLLSGDYLQQQLRELEQSYLDNDRRCFELTKRISLSELMDINGNPALVKLLKDGECEFDIPEWIYDLDYRNHGNRRIKHVSVTIPCVVGPNTNVNCRLTLLRELRRTKDDSGKNLSLSNLSDMPNQPSIVTSTAVNDSGMFEVNFNDIKYLPFEGYGAVSRWRISLPIETNHFDRSTVSDVILNISYYAQDMGTHQNEPMTFLRLVSARHEFPAEWHKCSIDMGDLTITLDEKMIQSHLRSRFSSFKLSAVIKQTYENGVAKYESIAGGYNKDGAKLMLSQAGTLIDRGAKDILFAITCEC